MSLDDAFEFHNEGRIEEAIAAYRAVIAAGDPDGVAAYWRASVVEPDGAETLYRAALRQGETRAYGGLAWLLYDQPDRAADAEAVFDEAIHTGADGMLRGLGQLVARDRVRAVEAEAILREA